MPFAPEPEIRGRILLMHYAAGDETMVASLGFLFHRFHYGLHRRSEGFELIAKIAQPIQTIIDIEKTRLASHQIISDPSISMESEKPRIGEVLRTVHLRLSGECRFRSHGESRGSGSWSPPVAAAPIPAMPPPPAAPIPAMAAPIPIGLLDLRPLHVLGRRHSGFRRHHRIAVWNPERREPRQGLRRRRGDGSRRSDAGAKIFQKCTSFHERLPKSRRFRRKRLE
jgi:hypothetical protein